MRKPRQTKGMKLLMSSKRLPRRLAECLHARAPGKWHVYWNHDTKKFDVWALPGVEKQCPVAMRAVRAK